MVNVVILLDILKIQDDVSLQGGVYFKGRTSSF